MTTIQRAFAVSMLLAFASLADAGVRDPAPGAGADVLHQQGAEKLVAEDEEEDEEDEEPDCE